jgi:hypothetical protein
LIKFNPLPGFLATMSRMRFLISVCWLVGCAGAGFPDIIEPNEIPSALGAPSIDRVRDAGNVRIPIAGGWKGESDGVACPGELVVIEGDNFGRLPTVNIGGRATGVLARTSGGGIVARVPGGVPAGKITVSVSQPKGKSQKELTIRRLSVVVHDGKVHLLEVQKDGLAPIGQPLALPGAHTVRLSGDGAAAYLLAGEKIVTVDLTGLRISQEMRLSHKAHALTSAVDAPLVAAIGDGKLTLFSTKVSSRPAPYEAIDLPKDARGAHAFELSPDGKLLAALLPEGNKLVVLELQESPPALRPFTTVDLLPGERLPLVRDLSWASDGETLWVVSGDNVQSLPAVEPTRLTAVRIMNKPSPDMARDKSGATDKNAELISVWRTQSIPGATAPLHVAVARGQPLASGTTIRMPPEKAAVFVSSVADNLFKLAESTIGPAVLDKLWRPARPAMIVRADINGGGGPLFASPVIMSSVDLTPDAQLVVATAARVAPAPATKSVVLDFGVIVSPVWGSPTPVFVSLGALEANELKPPFYLGEVRIQP